MCCMDNGEGELISPPTPQQYRLEWEYKSAQLSANEFRRISEKNLREARKAIFQEAVQKQVSVKRPELVTNFHSVINIVERPSNTKRTNRKG